MNARETPPQLAQFAECWRELYRRRADGYVAACEALLLSLADQPDTRCIGVLYSLLDDDAEYDELMYSLVHTAEGFSDPAYCGELLSTAPELWLSSPRWSSIIFIRVLNSDACRRELVRRLPESTPEIKAAVRGILAGITKEPGPLGGHAIEAASATHG
ncbi:MAG: Imm30 family immunity protein [Planctomycetota bacterium]